VFPATNSFYADWRLKNGAVPLLHDDRESPPENLLQAIWQHQRLLRHQLKTSTGEILRVLHPGFLNREGGPDFRGAVVQIGDAPSCSGDVELDIRATGWHAHGHDCNPAFRNVMLHVIWDELRIPTSAGPGHETVDPSKPEFPSPPATMSLRPYLDAPIGELAVWLNSDAPEMLPENMRGHCCAPLRDLTREKIGGLLREAGQIRFRAKAAQLQARARQVGWQQSLWEGLFRALGYKHNAWPMQCLAEHRERLLTPRVSPLELQARLFGLSGLLPSELTRAQSSADGYLRRVWDQWWREREEFADCVLPRSLWRFHGQRPANHPQRRLALAAHWLVSGSLADKLERWCAENLPDRRLAGSLLEIFQIQQDDFWSWHWTMRSGRLKKPQPMLGAARVTDLAVNVILPWLWIRAGEGKNENLLRAIEHRFEVWPAAEDNAELRLARQRLLGNASPRALRGAAEQQGLMQIVRDFCEHSNAVCEHCGFPEMLKAWSRGAPG
jgi:hypothetical protein